MKLMSHSDVGCLDEEEREIYGQAIAEAGLVGAHAVERMLAAHLEWAKFLWRGNPRFSKSVWIEYERILATGFDLRPDIDGEWGDGVVADGEHELCRVRIGEQPRLYVRLPVEAAVRRASELAEGAQDIEDAEVVTHWARGHVDVEVPLVGAEHGVVVKALRGLAVRILRPEEPEPRSCVQVLREAGVGVPRSLVPLLERAQEVGNWYWATDPSLTTPQQEYLLDDIEWLREPVADQVVVSHCGHGANSYALTVRLAVGRVTIHAQESYGGAFTDAADDAVAVTRMLHECAKLVDDHAGSWDDTPRGRDVAVLSSRMRCTADVWTWDDRLRRWEAVPLGDDRPLAVARRLLDAHARG